MLDFIEDFSEFEEALVERPRLDSDDPDVVEFERIQQILDDLTIPPE